MSDCLTPAEIQGLLADTLSPADKARAEAQPLLLEGYEGMKHYPEATDERKREALERIVRLYEGWHKPEQAVEWRAKLPTTQRVAADEQGTSSNGE